MQHVNAPVPSLCQTREEVPWALDQIYQKMVAKRPADRYASMDEVVQGREDLQAGSSGLSRLAATADESRLASVLDFTQLNEPAAPEPKAAPQAAVTQPTSKVAPAEKPTAMFVAAEAETDPKSELLVRTGKITPAGKQEAGGSERAGVED